MEPQGDDLPEFHPQTIIREWGDGQAFRLADAQTGVCVFGATGSGKTSGPAKHLAYGYLAAGFGGLAGPMKRVRLPRSARRDAVLPASLWTIAEQLTDEKLAL